MQPSSIGLLDSEAIFAIGVKSRECLVAWAEGLRFYKVIALGLPLKIYL